MTKCNLIVVFAFICLYVASAYFHDVDLVKNFSATGNAKAWSGDIICGDKK